MKLFNSILLSVLLLASCSSNPKFTDDERTEARNFITSLNADIESIAISNSHQSFETITTAELTRMLELKKEALTYAQMISTEVLSKMHDELPTEYENYKRGLALRIKNLEEEDVSAELEGSQLLDRWTDWYSANKRDIMIPR